MELWQAVLAIALCVGLGASASALPTVLGNFPKPANRHFNYAAAGNSKQFAQVFEDVKVGSIDAEFEAGRVFLLHERVTPVVPTKDRHCRPDFPVTTKIEVRFTKSEQASGQSPRQHTLGHIDCPACESRKQRAMRVNLAPSLTFREAAEHWKNSRQDQLSEGSLRNYGDYIKALTCFFGDMRLDRIHIGHVEEYQEMREETCGASRLNHEISCLQQILKRAGLWDEIKKFYEPKSLPSGEGPGIALEEDEEQHLFMVAAKKPKWKVAYWCALISANTTMGPGEIRMLQIKDVNLSRREVCVRQGLKTKFRLRTLPLNDDAVWAMQQLLDLGNERGSYLPEHYILSYRPHVAGAKYDPTKPMGSWKVAWKSLRKEAGKKFPRLATLRRYDLRHHAATKLLEDPRVSERTIEQMMGHRLNSRTKERYSHIRTEKKIAAVEILCSGHAPGTEVTPKKPVQVAKNIESSTISFLFTK
jgi:integrase